MSQRAAAVTVASGPDLVVEAVSGPASVVSGNGFSAQVKVCNRGGAGASADVELFLSQDAAITPSDLNLGGSYFGYLSPGQCATQSLPASAYVADGTWYVGAITDRYGNVAELDESNNARASNSPMVVGYGPDFVVKSVKVPTSLYPGQSFTATVTLCNEGTDWGSPSAQLVLSQDTNIQLPTGPQPSNDFPLSPVYVGSLSPGQCSTSQVFAQANAPQDGAWYVGVAIEPSSSGAPELRTDNNARASDEPVGIGSGPDFVVKAVKGPASVQPGQSFTATVTLCNQGTDSGSPYADLVLSQDTNIQSPTGPQPSNDFLLTQVYVGYLSSGQCSTTQVYTQANAPQNGVWYLGVSIGGNNWGAPELRTDNNVRASDSPMSIGYGPDYVVKSVKGPASVQPWSSFTATVTLCNQGTDSGSPYASLVLSKDTTIQLPTGPQPSDDYLLASVYVGYLSPGQCSTTQVAAQGYAPQDGPWYLGVAIEPDPYGSLELRTDNNTRASDEPVGIGYGPDFVVKSIQAPASLYSSQSFTTLVTLCNQGTDYGTPNANLMLSADRDIQSPYNQSYPGDSQLASVNVGSLAPGQCATTPVYASLWVPQNGPWYLGVVIESNPYSYPQELRTDNNVRASDEPVGIGSGPDFVVKSVKGPASVPQGQSFTATVTLCNQGTDYGTPYAQLVLSQDTSIEVPVWPSYQGGDPLLAPVNVGQLAPGQCATQQVQASAWVSPDGPWYLGAIIDSSSYAYPYELRTDNNTRASDEPVGIGNLPDFVVKSVSGPTNVRPGDPFTATVTVCNEGTQSGQPFANLMLSADTSIQFTNQPYLEDFPVGPVDVGHLYPGQCVTKQVQGYAYVPQNGLWYLGAAIEVYPGPTELRTDNNTLASASPMGVGNGPDFAVKSVTGPASVKPGDPFTASVKLCNEGTEPGSTYAHLVLSQDTNIQLPFNQPYPEDMLLAPVDGGYLQPGQCVTKQVQAHAYVPQDGVWYLGAAIEASSSYPQELRTDNNARASDEPMGVGYKPDFVVQSVTGPASVKPGDPFTATVTVCNQGTEPGTPNGMLVLSQDTNIQLPFNQPAPEDFPVGPVNVGTLQPGQCASQQVSGNAWVQEGLWYLGAGIDSPSSSPSTSSELRTDNNTRASAEPVGIGFAPDFVVQSVSGPSSLMVGGSFTATVTLCNQGTEPGSPYAHLLFSKDTDIQLPFNSPSQEDFPLGPVNVGTLSPGQCATVQVNASAYAPQDGDWFLGAAIEANSGPAELNTRNNSKAGNVVALHY